MLLELPLPGERLHGVFTLYLAHGNNHALCSHTLVLHQAVRIGDNPSDTIYLIRVANELVLVAGLAVIKT